MGCHTCGMHATQRAYFVFFQLKSGNVGVGSCLYLILARCRLGLLHHSLRQHRQMRAIDKRKVNHAICQAVEALSPTLCLPEAKTIVMPKEFVGGEPESFAPFAPSRFETTNGFRADAFESKHRPQKAPTNKIPRIDRNNLAKNMSRIVCSLSLGFIT